MKNLYGVVNHNIEHVKVLLDMVKEKEGVKCQVLGFGDTPKRKANVVLVPSASQFLKHYKTLNKMSGASVFVFDNPIMCKTIRPLKMLDVALEEEGFKYVFKRLTASDIVSAIKQKEAVNIDVHTVNVIPTLLGKTIPGTLNEFMTFLYSVKTDQRHEVAKFVYLWIVSDKPVGKLEKKVNSVLGVQRTPKAFKRLRDYLKSDTFTSVRPAFNKAYKAKKDGKGASIGKIAKDFKMDPYDLRYVVNHLDKMKKPKYTNVDTADLFKQHLKNRAANRKFKEETDQE